MAQLADDVINRIKQEEPLVRLVQSQGHQIKKHGKDYVLSCPFHDDKTASLVITPKTNLFNCSAEFSIPFSCLPLGFHQQQLRPTRQQQPR